MQRIIGKIVGTLFGFLAGGPAGALAGLALGHMRDIAPAFGQRVDEERDREARAHGFSDRLELSSYMIGIIVLSAKLAKSDGRVSRKEIAAFRRVFKINDEGANEIGRLFDQSRLTPAGFEPYATKLGQIFHPRPDILEEILRGLLEIALSDSADLRPEETAFLREVTRLFGLPDTTYERVSAEAKTRRPSAETDAPHRKAYPSAPSSPETEAYAVLGVIPSVSDQDLKHTYHALIRKHHPDRLLAEGQPQEVVAQATEKMKRINVAYTLLCKTRGLK